MGTPIYGLLLDILQVGRLKRRALRWRLMGESECLLLCFFCSLENGCVVSVAAALGASLILGLSPAGTGSAGQATPTRTRLVLAPLTCHLEQLDSLDVGV